MALAAFDTLKVANRLKAVGVPSAQAEAEAEVLSEIFETNLKELATKDDLRRGLEKLELRLTIRLGFIVAAAITLAPSIIKFLHLPT